MPLSSKQTKIVAFAESGPTLQQITNALGGDPEFELVDVFTSPDDQLRAIRAAEPDMILVDTQVGEQPVLDSIDEIAVQFPNVSLIAILPTNDPLIAQQVMLAGARGFISQPFTQINLLSTLRRIRDLELRRMQTHGPETITPVAQKATPLRTLSVFGPKGGTGSSMVAVNLAVSIFEETRQPTLLVDGNLFTGHLGLMLNIRTKNTIADLIPHAGQMDDSLIRDVVVEHATGIHVLLRPFAYQFAQGIRPQDIFSVLVGLQRMYTFVIIDIGSSLSENSVTFMDSSDRVMVVTTPDLASLHDTRRFIELSRSALAYPPEKLMFVLNRDGLTGSVREADVISALPEELIAKIPDGGPNVLRSINRGIPLVLNYPRNPASKEIQTLAKALVRLSNVEFADAVLSQSATGLG